MTIRRPATVAATLALTLALGSPSFAQTPSDWKSLFDGKGLDGWDHVGPGRFVIDGGQLRTEGGMGLLYYSREKLGDCTILQTRHPAVEFRTLRPDRRQPADPWYADHHGFEVQIADGGKPTRGTQCRIPSSAHATGLSLDNKAFCCSFIVSKRGGLGGL
jgi:hypothetical protein